MMTPFSLGQPLAPDFVRNFISLNDSEYATEYIEFHYTASPAGRTVGLQRKPSDTASTAMYHLYLLQAVLHRPLPIVLPSPWHMYVPPNAEVLGEYQNCMA